MYRSNHSPYVQPLLGLASPGGVVHVRVLEEPSRETLRTGTKALS